MDLKDTIRQLVKSQLTGIKLSPPKTKRKPEPFLSWDGSFSSNRGTIDDKTFNSMYGDAGEPINEEMAGDFFLGNRKPAKWYNPEVNPNDYKEADQTATIYDSNNGTTFHAIHGSRDVRPQNLSEAQSKAVVDYCSASSKETPNSSAPVMNAVLRLRSGDNTTRKPHTHDDLVKDDSEVTRNIEKLANTFTPENTNRIKIKSYAGIPQRIGERIDKNPGGKFHMAAFTSSSTRPQTALTFAMGYRKQPKKYNPDADTAPVEHHMMVLHHDEGDGVKTAGASMSVAYKSPYIENEVVSPPTDPSNPSTAWEHLGSHTVKTVTGHIIRVHHFRVPAASQNFKLSNYPVAYKDSNPAERE
jgi:hypothetical protein